MPVFAVALELRSSLTLKMNGLCPDLVHAKQLGQSPPSMPYGTRAHQFHLLKGCDGQTMGVS